MPEYHESLSPVFPPCLAGEALNSGDERTFVIPQLSACLLRSFLSSKGTLSVSLFPCFLVLDPKRSHVLPSCGEYFLPLRLTSFCSRKPLKDRDSPYLLWHSLCFYSLFCQDIILLGGLLSPFHSLFLSNPPRYTVLADSCFFTFFLVPALR